MDQTAIYIGYSVAAIASAAVILAALSILSAWGLSVFKDLHKVAVNSYWWVHWIRWNRIAQHRKEARRLLASTKNSD